MSKPETITIDDVQYVRADSVRQNVDGEVKILVLERGFVIIGHAILKEGYWHVSNCSTIRIWGTKKGLGELCYGPTKSTKLDPQCDTKVHELRVVQVIDCDGESWKNL